SAHCGNMPPVITRSAQARSASVRSSALRLTRRKFHDDGSSAASVMRPSGGAGQRAPQTSQTACKFQNEFGLNLGNTSSAFGLCLDMVVPRCFRLCQGRPRRRYATLATSLPCLIRFSFCIVCGPAPEQRRRAAPDVELVLMCGAGGMCHRSAGIDILDAVAPIESWSHEHLFDISLIRRPDAIY